MDIDTEIDYRESVLQRSQLVDFPPDRTLIRLKPSLCMEGRYEV